MKRAYCIIRLHCCTTRKPSVYLTYVRTALDPHLINTKVVVSPWDRQEKIVIVLRHEPNHDAMCVDLFEVCWEEESALAMQSEWVNREYNPRKEKPLLVPWRMAGGLASTYFPDGDGFHVWWDVVPLDFRIKYPSNPYNKELCLPAMTVDLMEGMGTELPESDSESES
ncbi:hypothetical protein PtrSN002B_010484 [Pyrenophora tritici-repentis]|uniref:Uncharacterized protein n=1 Tax=Pyrenophora tritici-repentis TaxID=45151 RepID=A0A2W1GZP9_9PLEO|nr:hypothetical protein PtrV1_09087 [Pyrenophora tritici-repentis]KAF7442020.1 hypothetical protein A1F99_138720 [Pyrenophora tritici-repentis]KAF7568030.1 hypothetical protein PtrM4_126430 [Pyrenophora tritici-repentis]KAG9376848.1 hypothetical protein A1F94_012448 [Pyrenophora tritici-repentis]KAI0587899.1 hypothetical protein Alg215_01251 [Pyrenophora tritici-repentis]